MFFLLFLHSLPLFGVTFSLDHLVSLPLPLFDLLLFLSPHLSLILFLVKLPPQTIQLLSISASLLFLTFKLLENLILSLFLFLSYLLNGFFSRVQLLDVSKILGLLLSNELNLGHSLLLLDLEGLLHVLECFLFLLVLDSHLSQFAIEEGLHYFFDLFLLAKVLLVGLSFLLCLLIYLHLQNLLALVTLPLLISLHG